MNPARRCLYIACLSTALCILAGCASSRQHGAVVDGETTPFKRFVQDVVDDHRRHYKPEVLVDLLPPLLVAGTLANTNADRWIADSWQDDTRSDASDNVARVFLHAGDAAQNRISAPLYTLTMLAAGYEGHEDRDAPVATWAARSLRANILGGPQAFVLTYALGSHRPDVGDSRWNPMNDNDGVSGHSFYGAVPFLTAARMSEQAGWPVGWKYSFYTLSMLPAWARINGNRHYTSQAVMGWSVAWLATRTIADRKTDRKADQNATAGKPSITPLLLPEGGYLLFSWQF